MRRSWILAVPILLLAVAVSGEPSKPSAACPAASPSTLGEVLPQGQPTPLFMTNICGTCADAPCIGLPTGSPCADGSGTCFAVVNGATHQQYRCPAPGTGYLCLCLSG